MIAVIHPSGNANVRGVLNGLEGAGRLSEFHTAVAFPSAMVKSSWIPHALREELERREFSIPSHKIRTYPCRELLRLASLRSGFKKGISHETGMLSVDRIWQQIDRKASTRFSPTISGVYAYEDAALNSFREAKRRGISCFYDLPIGYCRSAQKILQEEKELMPAFAPALQGISDSPEKLARKEEEALMADRILACSEFVRQTLIESGFPVEKIRTVQFGAPSQVSPRNWSAADLSRPLRLLFAGKLDQRKGIGYLLEALKLKNDSRIELTLLGRYEGAGEWLAPYRDFFRHVPALPHSGVLRLMKESDVMILPSLFEGQALVVLEAMACGIPVIITPNTGAASVVRDGQDGMVIPIRSSTAISEALEVLLQDRSRVVEMGRSAAARAEKFTWKSYESQVVEVIRERLEGKKGDEKN